MQRCWPTASQDAGLVAKDFSSLKIQESRWVFPKNRGFFPKMDGENHGKAYYLMDDLGGKNPLFLETSWWWFFIFKTYFLPPPILTVRDCIFMIQFLTTSAHFFQTGVVRNHTNYIVLWIFLRDPRLGVTNFPYPVLQWRALGHREFFHHRCDDVTVWFSWVAYPKVVFLYYTPEN